MLLSLLLAFQFAESSTEAQCIVPQRIELNNITTSWNYRFSVGSRVHPCHSLILSISVKESVRMQFQIRMVIAFNKEHDTLDELTIFLQTFLLAGFLSILLKSPDCPERNIRLFQFGNIHRDILSFHEFLISLHGSLHHQFKVVIFLYREGKTRQRDKCISRTALEPRITSQNVSVIIFLTTVELMGSIDKTMEEIVTRGSFCHFLIKKFLQCTGLDFRCRCSKDYALTFLDWHLKITRYIKVLIGSIATLLLLRILHTTIPVWGKNKLILLGELHIKVWITCIHTSLDTIIHC